MFPIVAALVVGSVVFLSLKARKEFRDYCDAMDQTDWDLHG